MAFYDVTQEQRSQSALSPLQQALSLPPSIVLQHQNLLSAISAEANFSDEKCLYHIDVLLQYITTSISNNDPNTSLTSLYISDYCVRNGNIFSQYIFGRYILQKLYRVCSRDLTKVNNNDIKLNKLHQQFQYKLIETIIQWHSLYSTQPGSTLNYTFQRLKSSGILTLYQSYKQTQNIMNNINPIHDPIANSHAHAHAQNLNAPISNNLPNLPPSPQPPSADEKQNIAQYPPNGRGRAKTDIVSSAPSNDQAVNRNRAKTLSTAGGDIADDAASSNNIGIDVDKLLHRDGRVKLEYAEKFQYEINVLISRYIKPTRNVLSSRQINLADVKLQKYLQILQQIQQRLVRIIQEVKNMDSIVSLAIKANDCIVATIKWFNSLVKKSKANKDKNKDKNSKNNNLVMEKSLSVSKKVSENIDLVSLEQQLLLDNANLFKQKELRDIKIIKDIQKQRNDNDNNANDNDNIKNNGNAPVMIVNNDNIVDNDNIPVDIISEPQPKQDAAVAVTVAVPVAVAVQQEQEPQIQSQSQPQSQPQPQSQDVSVAMDVVVNDIMNSEPVDNLDIVSQQPQKQQDQPSGFSSLSSIKLNSTSNAVNDNDNDNDNNNNVIDDDNNDDLLNVVDNNNNNNNAPVVDVNDIIDNNIPDNTQYSDNDDDVDVDDNDNDDNDVAATMILQTPQNNNINNPSDIINDDNIQNATMDNNQ